MKRILKTLLILTLTIALVGCSNKSAGTQDNPTQAPSNQDAVTTKEPTAVPTEVPAAEPTEVPLAADAGEFETKARSFSLDGGSELYQVVLDIFPVDAATAVIQAECYDARENSDIPDENCYTFTCSLANRATYISAEGDITVTINQSGAVTLSSSDDAYKNIVGTYNGTGSPISPDKNTIFEYIRCIPAAGIGDFGAAEGDAVEEYIVKGWFHDIVLLRNGEVYKNFVATDDMTGLAEITEEACELIYGSMDTTLEQTVYYYVYSDDEAEDTVSESYIVSPYIVNGTSFGVGETSFVEIDTVYDLPYVFEVSSADVSIIDTDGNVLTAMAEGETEVLVMLDYAGSRKEYRIPVTVEAFDDENEYSDSEYLDSCFTSWNDSISERATMELTLNDDGNYSADVFWAEDAETLNHWSLIGETDPNNSLVINLRGCYTLEAYAEGGDLVEISDAEDVTATLTYEESGCLRWNIIGNDSIECLFENIDGNAGSLFSNGSVLITWNNASGGETPALDIELVGTDGAVMEEYFDYELDGAISRQYLCPLNFTPASIVLSGADPVTANIDIAAVKIEILLEQNRLSGESGASYAVSDNLQECYKRADTGIWYYEIPIDWATGDIGGTGTYFGAYVGE